MPITECDYCGGPYRWSWTEAFEKFGFRDGDGQVETWQVEAVLTEAGYTVAIEDWSLHNTVIFSTEKDGIEHIAHAGLGWRFGYDDPRSYLPAAIVRLLDEKLPDA